MAGYVLIPLALATAVLAGCMDPTTTPPPSDDLSDFVGARAGQAEMGLQSRGYAFVRSEGLTSYWTRTSTNACAAITTGDGRYVDITMVGPEAC